MSQKITYHWGDNDLLIKLGNRVEPRIRVLFWAEFILATGWATIVLLNSNPLSLRTFDVLIAIGASALFMLAAYRFLSRMFCTEQLLLRRDSIDIINKTPFAFRARTFSYVHMGPLHYAGQGKKTDHPLKGKCYDYFGFETQEKLVQKLHNEGNLLFNYGGFPIVFGKGVYSWHAEEIISMMQLFTCGRLVLGPEWKQMAHEQETEY